MTGKFDLTNVNDIAFYISGPKLLFETTEISTHPNSTQQESNYIYLYTTKFGTSIKIRLNRKFESTEFETMRVNCIFKINLPLYKGFTLKITYKWWPLTTLNRWPLYRIKIYSKMHQENTKVTAMSRWPLYKGDR